MKHLWIIVGLALLPGLENFAVGRVAEFLRNSPRLLIALNTKSDILIGVVAIELMHEALNNLAGWRIAGAFPGGSSAYFALVCAGLGTLLQRGFREAGWRGPKRNKEVIDAS